MSDKLLPCPFCGSEKHSVFPPTCDKNTPYNPNDRAFPIIRCGGCFTEVPGKDWDASCKSAAQRWNDRAPDAAKDAEIAKLRDVLKPFAALADGFDGIPPRKYFGDTDCELRYSDDAKALLKVKFLRAARAALKEKADA